MSTAATAGNAEGFPGRRRPHPAADHFFHGLLALALALVIAVRGVAADGDPSPEPPPAAPAPPAASAPPSAAVGPLLVDEILNRYDLNGDGSVDEIEATIGQAKLRRRRLEQRAQRGIDPVTSRPRGQSDPTAPLGFRAGEGNPTDEAASSAPIPDPADGPRADAAVSSASEARQRRIMEALGAQRGRTAPRGGRDGGSASPRGPQGPGTAAPEPYGWIPGGDGTVFRGGSYPLPGRSRSTPAGRGGPRGGAGPLLPGAAPAGSAAARSGSSSGTTRYTTPPASRATVPQPSRGSGKAPGTPTNPSSSGGR